VEKYKVSAYRPNNRARPNGGGEMTANATNAGRPSERPSSTHPGFRRWLVIAGVEILLLIVAFAIGFSRCRGELALERRRADAAELNLRSAQAAASLTNARLLLYRAAMELDRRNFGTAAGFVAGARGALARVSAPDAHVDASSLDAARQKVAALRIDVSQDVSTQRGQVLDAVASLDALQR